MAGHISERTWDQVSDEVNRKLNKLVQFITDGQSVYEELVRLWAYHGNDDTEVTRQLFNVPEGETPTAEQEAKVADLKAAMIAVNTINSNSAIMNALRMMS